MAKIIKEAHNDIKVSKELKEEFFKKLRDLCCLYGVLIIPGTSDFSDELKEQYITIDKKDIHDTLPCIFFEFADGSNYVWNNQELNYSNYNEYINDKDEKDVIGINGVRYDQDEND